ncbi:MAG: hypothetical protein EOO94_03000 [Pedobacter sp.]|nr:MAG: hypothetical protein EOO94_03000 [Pedobacter sp.]
MLTDTVTINIEDSLTLSKLTGYYKIARVDGGSFETGFLWYGNKTGLWKTLSSDSINETITLLSLASYDNGKLNGRLIDFYDDSYPYDDFYYKNNVKVGFQREFGDSGKPVLIYETNEEQNFINDYYAISLNGDTLYHTNFGKEATGLVKRYNRWGALEREGNMVKGKMDTVIDYWFDIPAGEYTSATFSIYTDSSSQCFRVDSNLHVKDIESYRRAKLLR